MATYRGGQRPELISGLTELALFLDEHPELPIPLLPELHASAAYHRRDHAARDVADVAELLGSSG